MIIPLYLKGMNLDTEKLFAYRAVSRSFLLMWPHLVIPTPGITERELATLLTLSERLAEVGLEPLNIGSSRKKLAIEPSWH